MRFRLPSSLLACLMIATAGCNGLAFRGVAVQADFGANQDSVTALDIVFAYEHAALAQLPKTGPAWFTQKSTIVAQYGPAIGVVSLQVPPGSPPAEVKLPAGHRRAVAIIAFVDFIAPAGQPAISLTGFRHAVIRLRATTVDVIDQPKPAQP